jgi:hypothetical protein
MPGRNDFGAWVFLVVLVVLGVAVVFGCIALTGAPPGMGGERM